MCVGRNVDSIMDGWGVAVALGLRPIPEDMCSGGEPPAGVGAIAS